LNTCNRPIDISELQLSVDFIKYQNNLGSS